MQRARNPKSQMADSVLRVAVAACSYPSNRYQHSYHRYTPQPPQALRHSQGFKHLAPALEHRPLPNMASSSMSPPNIKNEYGGVGTGIAYGAQPSHDQVPSSHDENNPLGLGLVNNLTEKRLTRDGQPTRRRGPKPDSKPALTRRQELNRQAQR